MKYNVGQTIKITSEPYQREYLYGKLGIIIKTAKGIMGSPIYQILVQGYPNKLYHLQEEDIEDNL